MIMLALVSNEPKVMNLMEMLKLLSETSGRSCDKTYTVRLNKAKERAHILEGLLIALDNIDEVIQIIRGSRRSRSQKQN